MDRVVKLNMRTLNDMFKIKIEHEGRPMYKGKVKGFKGLKRILDDLEFKMK